MGNHRTLEGQRPVHPECPKLDRSIARCQCDELWEYWDGTDADLDSLITTAERQDMRRWPHAHTYDFSDDTFGGIDRISSDESAEFPNKLEYDAEASIRGFWKDSEQLKTVRKK